MVEEKGIKVKIEQVISYERISDLLCCAYEGGSNYWAVIGKMGKPDNSDNTPKDYKDWKRHDYPINKGGYVEIESDDGENKGVLNLESIEKGLVLMAKEYPTHFNDFMTGNDDATTGDVFLQLCVFGKLIYG